MSKFNLKNYTKTNGDEHISRRLSEQHSSAPNAITQKQLMVKHVPEKQSITEKQLNKTRSKEEAMTIEARLNEAKSRFDIKHRNEKASSGNINKLEEQRIAGDRNEKEKYESASSTHKSMRWWEKHKNEDRLKVASRLIEEQMKKISQSIGEPENDDGKTDLAANLIDDKERFKKLDKMWGAIDEGIVDDEPGNEFVGKSVEKNESDEEIELGVSKDLFLAEKRENMPSGMNPYTFFANIGFDPTGWDNKDELENAVLEMVLKIRPDLDGKLSTEDLSKPKYFGDRGYYAVRLVGDEYAPQSTAEEQNMFEEISVEDVDSNGTPVTIGKIKINIDPLHVDDETIQQDIADFINANHPNLKISADAITLDMNEMEASFAVSKNGVISGNIDRMPLEADDTNTNDVAEEQNVDDEFVQEGIASDESFPVSDITEQQKLSSSNNKIFVEATKKK